MFSLLLAVIYLAFISLGLPDSLLGSVWPMMHQQLQVPVSYSGIIFAIISGGTIISSLMSDYLSKKFGSGRITAVSVLTTAIALFGFSFSHSMLQLVFWALPYGLGAGSVDSSLNNYVALHFESRHMSWLHCMWGLGASIGPYIMSFAILHTGLWNNGYRIIGIIQTVLSFVILMSLPLWIKKEKEDGTYTEEKTDAMPFKDVLAIKGAKEIFLAFFCYCAVEQTVCLWASSYLVFNRGVEEIVATSFAALFYLGITFGRFINGFLTHKLNDKQLVTTGHFIMALAILLLFIPDIPLVALIGFTLFGIGCAPVYPCIIHSTPELFGKENSQAMIGVQMASAYTGILVMPPLFGFLSNLFNISILPVFLGLILILEILMYNRIIKLHNK